MNYHDWIQRYEQLITEGETPLEAAQSIRQWHHGDNYGRLHDHLTKYMRLRTKAFTAEAEFTAYQQQLTEHSNHL